MSIEANVRDLNDAEVSEAESRARQTANQWAGGYHEALDYQLQLIHNSLVQSFNHLEI